MISTREPVAREMPDRTLNPDLETSRTVTGCGSVLPCATNPAVALTALRGSFRLGWMDPAPGAGKESRICTPTWNADPAGWQYRTSPKATVCVTRTWIVAPGCRNSDTRSLRPSLDVSSTRAEALADDAGLRVRIDAAISLAIRVNLRCSFPSFCPACVSAPILAANFRESTSLPWHVAQAPRCQVISDCSLGGRLSKMYISRSASPTCIAPPFKARFNRYFAFLLSSFLTCVALDNTSV